MVPIRSDTTSIALLTNAQNRQLPFLPPRRSAGMGQGRSVHADRYHLLRGDLGQYDGPRHHVRRHGHSVPVSSGKGANCNEGVLFACRRVSRYSVHYARKCTFIPYAHDHTCESLLWISSTRGECLQTRAHLVSIPFSLLPSSRASQTDRTCNNPIPSRRSLTPFAVCIGDFIWLGRAWPTTQSWFALVAMTLCTIFIFVREPTITAAGVFWGVVYYVLLSMVCESCLPPRLQSCFCFASCVMKPALRKKLYSRAHFVHARISDCASLAQGHASYLSFRPDILLFDRL